MSCEKIGWEDIFLWTGCSGKSGRPALLSKLFLKSKIKEVKGQLEYIALCIGPGSFTGLKIGSPFAKGLAASLDIPIVPIDNYETFKNDVKINDKYFLAIYSHKDYAFTCFVDNDIFSEYKCIKINTIKDYPIFGYGFPENINIKYKQMYTT